MNKIKIDLTGPDGNTFVLMAYAKAWSKQLDYNYDVILKDMKAGDYEHLIGVLEYNFGSFVTFERKTMR